VGYIVNASEVHIDSLVVHPDLTRSSQSVQFEERLCASIDSAGLAEPLKVAKRPKGRYVVIDGVMRLRALRSLRLAQPERFTLIPVYILEYSMRYELRYQTDIYQDLLPSQLASLVEHLHTQEHVSKISIGQYIGVSAPTVRNYTGLWRLIQRGGLFESIVGLMDLAVLPASNPYAWLRLTDSGLRTAIEQNISAGIRAEQWIDEIRLEPKHFRPLTLKQVEMVTSNLPSNCYRGDDGLRSQKKNLGLRRSSQFKESHNIHRSQAIKNLKAVALSTEDPVLKQVATSLRDYLA